MVAGFPATMDVREISLQEAQALLKGEGLMSAVGHADTATVLGGLLGFEVPANRTTVSLQKGETAVVGQYIGPRLPEGATELPQGARIVWLLVTVR